jgi:6-phosphogluconolactonase
VLGIRHDGSLRQVEDSPVSAGGSTPVTIAVHDDLVFVGNGGATSNYTGFRLNEGGHLRHLDNATFSLPSGTMPGDLLFDGDGSHLVGTRIGTGVSAATLPSEIDSFTVADGGSLTAAPGSPLPPKAPAHSGASFAPPTPTSSLSQTPTTGLVREASRRMT